MACKDCDKDLNWFQKWNRRRKIKKLVKLIRSQDRKGKND